MREGCDQAPVRRRCEGSRAGGMRRAGGSLDFPAPARKSKALERNGSLTQSICERECKRLTWTEGRPEELAAAQAILNHSRPCVERDACSWRQRNPHGPQVNDFDVGNDNHTRAGNIWRLSYVHTVPEDMTLKSSPPSSDRRSCNDLVGRMPFDLTARVKMTLPVAYDRSARGQGVPAVRRRL
jgi:hypothetical protein